jgi:hypothetical protein
VSTLTLPEVRQGVGRAVERRRWAARPAELDSYDRAVLAVYGGWLPPELAHLVVDDVARLIDRGQLRVRLPIDVAPARPLGRPCRARRRRQARRVASATIRAGADPPPSENVTTPGSTGRGWRSEHRETTRVQFSHRSA